MMSSEGNAMARNARIVREIFDTLYKISSRKTTEGYTYYLMQSLKEDLHDQYPFLSSFHFVDTRFSEEETFVYWKKNLEKIKTEKLCYALKDYIQKVNQSLGKNAGPFFFKEISSRISETSNELMKSYGVDLMIMQLEYEIDTLEKRIIKTTKNHKQ